MANTNNDYVRRTPWLLIIAWILTACLTSGLAALVLEMPSLWGGKQGVMEYLLPLPLTWGMLHWPGLILFSLGLSLAYQQRERWLREFRQLCVGVLLAVLAIAWLSEPLRGFPLLMFTVVDALTALLLAGFIRYPIGHTPIKSNKKTALRVLGPAAIASALVVAAPYFMSRYNFASSTTVNVSQDTEILQYKVYLNYGSGAGKKECRHLQRYADSRQYSRLEEEGLSYQQILLFENKEAIWWDSGESPIARFDWWPDGSVRCSADLSFGQ